MSCKKIFMNVRNQIPSKASWQFKMFNIAFKVMNTTFKWFATIICVNNTIIEGSLFHLYMCQNVVSTWDTSGGRCEHDMWQILREIWLFCFRTESPLRYFGHVSSHPIAPSEKWHNLHRHQYTFSIKSLSS